MEYLAELLDLFIKYFFENPVWQVVWVVGFIVSVYNFLFCKNRKFIFFTMVASFVWGIHYLSIWLIAGWLINAIDTVKNAIALKYEKSNKITIFFVILYLLIWFFTIKQEFLANPNQDLLQSLTSIIPTINAIAWTFLVFYVRWVWLNIWFMFVILLWAVYNFLGHSIGWLATDITLFFVWIIWIIRILFFEKKEEKK